MKKTTLLNSQLSKVIAKTAHGDMILIGDAGMPIPEGVEFIDLALKKDIPRFADVLETVLEELHIEEAIIDVELQGTNEELRSNIKNIVGDVKLREIPHEELKEISKNCVAAVRTGEYTPYSNIILVSGVVF